MEENASTSESDVSDAGCQPAILDYSHCPGERPVHAGSPPFCFCRISRRARQIVVPGHVLPHWGHTGFVVALLCLACLNSAARAEDALHRVKQSGRLVYGSDEEGGGPYAYFDPNSPRNVVGFEVDLMDRLARDLGVKAEFSHGQWDKLLQVLASNRIDAVVNGYEWTALRARDYLATRPYYIYELELLARRGGPLREWVDLKRAKPTGGRWRVGVLVNSAADTFATRAGGTTVEVVRFDGSADAMTAVVNGQLDGTVQDLPAVVFYRDRFPALDASVVPDSRGYYVIYLRRQDAALRDALDQRLATMVETGELRRIYEKYGIWTDSQAELASIKGPLEPVTVAATENGWSLVARYRSRLLDAACVTVALSVTSMPIAMALGLVIAVGRLYGPRPVQQVLAAYVEFLRGTPLMLQLFVLYFVLPKIGIALPAWGAGVAGLAINYSAYEAEIYRAGLQAIPVGQMEAALALGMSRARALQRVVIPQAVRIVIPPVTNDFIALFKDTSVCSVITLTELTREYSMLAQSAGGAVEFAVAVAALYLIMSLPLTWFSRWVERRLDTGSAVKGGALA
jgi:polar amino acid transport system substrate-binding protein